MKAQSVRAVDVLLLGPFMVWAAASSTDLPEWARWTLGAAGLATVVYNARNYQRAARGAR